MATRVILTRRVGAALATLIPAQRAQFNRLVQAIQMSPRAGSFYARDGAQRVLQIASASDVHIIYRVVYLVGRDDLTIVDVVIAEWTPPGSAGAS